MSIDVEFFVKDVLKKRSGKILFVGFANDDGTVRVGEKFILSYKIPRTLDDILNERPNAAPINIREISLTVTTIESMREFVKELPNGMTGALTLSGEGMEHVDKNTFLRTSSFV